MSLVLTLVIMAAIVILVAIMARVVIAERRVSHGYSDVFRAEMAAQAGAEDARQLLLQLFAKYPNSCTYWAATLGTSTTASAPAGTPGTVFMYRPQPPEKLTFDSRGRGADDVFVQPLISGGKLQDLSATALYNASTSEWAKCDQMLVPADVQTSNSIDINTSAYDGDTNGWIGKLWNPVTQKMEKRPIRVPWVNMNDDKGNLIGRYAFWVEDESFRVNVNTAQPGTRIPVDNATDSGSGASLTNNNTQGLGITPADISLRGVFSNADARGDLAQAVSDARGKLLGNGFVSTLQVGHADIEGATTLGQETKSLTTIYSGSDPVSLSGSKRLNINSTVALSNPKSGSAADPVAVKRTLQQIMAAIKYHSPNFGQRFFRKTTNLDTTTDVVTSNTILSSYSDIYLWKVAANVRDYICPDSQPTIVKVTNNIPTVLVGQKPTEAIQPAGGNNIYSGGQNPYIVQGKKNIPYLEEYVVKMALIGDGGYGATNGFSYTGHFQIMVDHYFKFWNPTNRDIHVKDLGPNPIIRIMNQPQIGVKGTTPTIPGGNQSGGSARDFDIPLSMLTKSSGGTPASDVIFPAGAVTIVSTDPACLATDATLPVIMKSLGSATVYYAPVLYFYGTTTRADSGSNPWPASVRYYVGVSKDSNGQPPSNGYRVSVDNRTGNQQDAGTKFILMNDYGLLDSEAYLLMERPSGGSSASPIVIDWDTGDRADPTQNFYRGGYLLPGFDTNTYNSGDPRAKNEQLTMVVSNVAYGSSQTRFNNDGLNDGVAPGNCRLSALNFNSSQWLDPFNSTLKNTSAPAVLANQPMQSIGEFGHIYDPVRKAPAILPTVEYQFGGGRTLRIGQPDELVTKRVAPSWNWASWRLCDWFTVNDDVYTAGKININGITRDNGQAFLAAALVGASQDPSTGEIDVSSGFKFLGNQKGDPASPSDERFAGSTLSKTGLQTIHDQLMSRLGCNPAQSKFQDFDPVAAGPFWERGELSQLQAFNGILPTGGTLPTPPPALASSGTGQFAANDRAREEIFRRLAEMITTRGSVYTVYAVGQACKMLPGAKAGDPPQVFSVSGMKMTFRIKPVWNPPLDTTVDNFDPTDSTAVSKRFRQPDSYETQILSVSY